ncbi:hypothetical protein P43SY_011047 [Pythium insidiosum]|uniref:Uncharacterized protein n=1 Tax=Pythium insidiosum TaxID=114742 RepID=A0AAD5L5J8_PYTIN|nr:hypothetical protein P43SY_011047 [Pythium insidiosum]
MDQSPQSPTPASDSAQSPPPVAVDDDVALHHRSISDDMPSPSGLPPPGKTFSAKASASSFASKLAFGGRKLLSPLTSAASGVKEKEGAQSPATQSAGEAPKSAVPTRTGDQLDQLAVSGHKLDTHIRYGCGITSGNSRVDGE